MITIDSTADFSDLGAVAVIGGSWSSGAVNGLHVEALVYQNDSNHLMRVETDGSGGVDPVPARFSSENTSVCNVRVAQDLNQVGNARVVWRRGTSNSCSGSWYTSALDAPATRAPDNFPGKPVVGLLDSADGSHDGWLVLESGEIKRLSPSGSLSSVSGNPATSIGDARHIDTAGNGTVFLNLAGNLYAWDETNGLTDLWFSLDSSGCPAAWSYGCMEQSVADEEELVFRADDMLFRTAMDENPPQVGLLDDADDPASVTVANQRIAVNNDHVVWTYVTDPTPSDLTDNNAETVIRRTQKDRTGGVTLRRVKMLDPVASATSQPFFARTGEWLFYTYVDAMGGVPTAVAEKIDGSERKEYPDAAWMGASVNLASFADLSQSIEIAYLIDGISTSSSVGAGTLKAVAGNNPGTPRNLGIVPADVDGMVLVGGFGASRLATVTASDGSGGTQTDVIFLDGETGGSLQRLTDTNGQNETSAPLF